MGDHSAGESISTNFLEVTWESTRRSLRRNNLSQRSYGFMIVMMVMVIMIMVIALISDIEVGHRGDDEVDHL